MEAHSTSLHLPLMRTISKLLYRMLGISSSAFLTGKYSRHSLSNSCDKKYLYPSSLKKHFMVSHRDQYEAYIVEKNSKYHHICGIHLTYDLS